MMTDERIAELRKRYPLPGMLGQCVAHDMRECLDEIERLKADHDASVTRWTIFLAEQRAEIERLQAKVDAAADYIAALRSGDPRREYCGKKYYAMRLLEKQGENGGDIVRDDLSDRVSGSLHGEDDE